MGVSVDVMSRPPKRIAIVVLAYNIEQLLPATLARIPASLMGRVGEILVFDDCSTDGTYEAALAYKRSKALQRMQVFRNTRNLSYGGNQQQGYRYAIDHGYDIVALLHGDGQYAPELMPGLLEPLERDEADLVMGSRMMSGFAALRGGMPLYKFLGNIVLTACENALLGTALSEFHSGYRLYNCHALAQVPFERCAAGFHFDTHIIMQFLANRFRIVERPIPTHYGGEVSHLQGIPYAYRCLEASLAYRLHRWGVKRYPLLDGKESGR